MLQVIVYQTLCLEGEVEEEVVPSADQYRLLWEQPGRWELWELLEPWERWARWVQVHCE